MNQLHLPGRHPSDVEIRNWVAWAIDGGHIGIADGVKSVASEWAMKYPDMKPDLPRIELSCRAMGLLTPEQENLELKRNVKKAAVIAAKIGVASVGYAFSGRVSPLSSRSIAKTKNDTSGSMVEHLSPFRGSRSWVYVDGGSLAPTTVFFAKVVDGIVRIAGDGEGVSVWVGPGCDRVVFSLTAESLPLEGLALVDRAAHSKTGEYTFGGVRVSTRFTDINFEIRALAGSWIAANILEQWNLTMEGWWTEDPEVANVPVPTLWDSRFVHFGVSVRGLVNETHLPWDFRTRMSMSGRRPPKASSSFILAR